MFPLDSLARVNVKDLYTLHRGCEISGQALFLGGTSARWRNWNVGRKSFYKGPWAKVERSQRARVGESSRVVISHLRETPLLSSECGCKAWARDTGGLVASRPPCP